MFACILRVRLERSGSMRIAIDSSVLIGSLIKARGAGARIVRAWFDGRFEVVSSDATLREARLVLDSRWLSRMVPKERVDALLQHLEERSIRVRGTRIKHIPLKDEGDRRLVEAAVEGHATYLVTADRELLRYRGYGGTEFVTPSELLRRLPS
jgi:putative PIN family toxin of toxin-antitoxin system